MMQLPQITNPGNVGCTLLNTESKVIIIFDSIKSVDQSFGTNFGATPLLSTPETLFYNQGVSPETKSVTANFNRRWKAEDTTEVIELLKTWAFKQAQKTPILVFQWGSDLFSPCILFEDVRVKESGHLSGKPTQLEVSMTLVKVSERFVK